MKPSICPGLMVAAGASFFLTWGVSSAAPPPPLTFSQVQQKGSHNSYQSETGESFSRRESIFDQLQYHHVRSLEIDIHRFESESGGQIAGAVLTGGLAARSRPVKGSDFAVYHEPFDSHTPTCTTLLSCLRQVRAFHDANPRHEPVSVFLEYKDTQWGPEHMPADLDRDLTAAFEPSALFKPADLLHGCSAGGAAPTLRAAVRKCGWPALDSLRGKILFVLMQTSDSKTCTVALPANSCDATAATVFSYAQNDAEAAARAAFIAPNDEGLAKSHVVFVNMNGRSQQQLNASACQWLAPIPSGCPAPLSRQLLEGVVVRKADDALASYDQHRADGNQILGSEETNIDKFPRYNTSNPREWPFSPREPAAHPEAQSFPDDETVVRLVATSGNLEGTHDSFAFAYAANAEATTTWRAVVSGAGDSGNEWAKGCLMARESLAPQSDYFAVCRPEGGTWSGLTGTRRARVQYRDAAHRATEKHEFQLNPVRDAVFLFLDTWKDDKGRSCYRGRVSNVATASSGDGATVENSPTVCYAAPLSLQGLAVSSHGDVKLKYLFGALSRADAGGPQRPLAASAFPQRSSIGAGATYLDCGDGSAP